MVKPGSETAHDAIFLNCGNNKPTLAININLEQKVEKQINTGKMKERSK